MSKSNTKHWQIARLCCVCGTLISKQRFEIAGKKVVTCSQYCTDNADREDEKSQIEAQGELKASARLIAAAPELLEALKQAVSACPCSFVERDRGHRPDCCAPGWLRIITKAEG